MLEERNLKVDLFALGLLALTIFLATALLSYDPADPPSKLVFPERTVTLNVCGRTGAMVSQILLGALGLGAYYLLFSLAALNAALLTRRTVNQPLLRLGGWLLSLVGVTSLAAMAAGQLSPGPVIGAGGYLGAAGRGVLQMNFASVGAYILTVSLIIGGLLLCTDYVLIRVFAWTIGRPARGLLRGLAYVGVAYAQRLGDNRPEVDSLEEAEEEDEDQGEVSIRIVGRPSDEQQQDELMREEQDEEEEEDEDEEEVEAEAGPKRKTLASMLRIARPKKTERDEVIEGIEAAATGDDASDYELPSADLLLGNEPICFEEHEKEVRRKAKILEKTFGDFGFQVRVVEIQTGPVIAQFEVELEAGLRLSRITGLADDLAIALRRA